MGEGDLADPLAKVAIAHPKVNVDYLQHNASTGACLTSQVNIGSYPNIAEDRKTYNIKFQLCSRDAGALSSAEQAVREALGPVFIQP